MRELIPLLSFAFSLGVLHTLEPGHCKTAMAGALITSKHPWLDPIKVGIASALGHTTSIVIFALLVQVFHEIFKHDMHKLSIIEFIIGLIIVAIGVFVLISSLKGHHACCCCSHHQHEHSIDNTHNSNSALPYVGFLMGLAPCPSVIQLSLASVGINGICDILFLAFAFSFGVALSFIAVGFLVTFTAKKIFDLKCFQRLSKFTVYLTPIIFIIMGIMMCTNTFTNEHLHHHHDSIQIK